MSILLRFFLGLMIGYIAGSFIESVAHQYISDAPAHWRRFWKRHPRLFRQLLETFYSHHVVHHVRTFRKDHVTQFSSFNEKDRLDEDLKRRGRHGELIRRARYAIKLQSEGAVTFVAPLLAFWPVIYVTFEIWIALGAMVTMAVPPILSNWVHPYLHMRQVDACKIAPKWISFLLRSAYGRKMVKNHFLHHRYEDCCYNLALGGDILRGTERQASTEDLADMERIGLLL
jgi:hypothetical protein